MERMTWWAQCNRLDCWGSAGSLERCRRPLPAHSPPIAARITTRITTTQKKPNTRQTNASHLVVRRQVVGDDVLGVGRLQQPLAVALAGLVRAALPAASGGRPGYSVSAVSCLLLNRQPAANHPKSRLANNRPQPPTTEPKPNQNGIKTKHPTRPPRLRARLLVRLVPKLVPLAAAAVLRRRLGAGGRGGDARAGDQVVEVLAVGGWGLALGV
jgi:hypothetical protein